MAYSRIGPVVQAEPDGHRGDRRHFAIFVALAGTLGIHDEQQLWGGWQWPALAFTATESTLAVFGPVWLLTAAQTRLGRPLRWVGPWVSRSAYGAFMLQGPILIGLAIALRPLAVAAEVKALILVSGAIAASFGLAWLLISRVRLTARIL